MTVQVVVGAPVPGRVVPMAEVPDPVFAQAMAGPGVAVDPVREPQQAVAPVAGLLVQLKPHAFVVVTDTGAAVLVHLGIDTVQLHGEGFELLAAKGDVVSAGRPVVVWDPLVVEAGGRSPVCPVVALEASAEALSAVADGRVGPGDPLFTWSR